MSDTAENTRAEADRKESATSPAVGPAHAAASLHRILDIAKKNGLRVFANNGNDQEWIQVENITVRRSL
jgi:hypothetical protein